MEEGMTQNRRRCSSRSNIDYVVSYSEEPMTAEEREQVLRLVAKIIADVYLQETQHEHVAR
jgi:hypothetical protein